jgi:nitrate/nitrite-specific signal transduction histidine kinase
VTIEISDNSHGFDFNKNCTNNTIGLAVIKDIASSLSGKLTVPAGGSSKYALTFVDIL